MTLEEFDESLECLIKLIMPPNLSEDLSVPPEDVLQVIEDHCEAIRGVILRRQRELGLPQVTDTPNLTSDR